MLGLSSKKVGGGLSLAGLIPVSPALLHLNQPPASRLRVVDVFGNAGDADSVGDKLDLVLHTSSELVCLGVAVHVDLLCSAGNDENRDITRVKHPCPQNVHVPDIQDTAIRFHAGLQVLLRKSLINGVLRSRQPELQSLCVALDVSVQDFWENVFAKLLQEGLNGKVGVHGAELLNDLCGLVLGKEASDTVRDAAGSGDKRVLRLFVLALHGEDALDKLVGVAEVSPRLLPSSILVQRKVRSSSASVRQFSESQWLGVLTQDPLA